MLKLKGKKSRRRGGEVEGLTLFYDACCGVLTKNAADVGGWGCGRQMAEC